MYRVCRRGCLTGGFEDGATKEMGLTIPCKPEFVRNIELDLNRDWHFGGAFLQTNVALFRSKYSNVQRQVVDTTTDRSEEHTSELQSLMRISYAVFCLKKKKKEYQKTTALNPLRVISTANTH